MSQKLPVNKFNLIKDTSQFNEDFVKKCNKESDELYFFEDDVQYLKKLHRLHKNLLFLTERIKLKKLKNLHLIYMTKLNSLYA